VAELGTKISTEILDSSQDFLLGPALSSAVFKLTKGENFNRFSCQLALRDSKRKVLIGHTNLALSSLAN
jgi:hypothetical protein